MGNHYYVRENGFDLPFYEVPKADPRKGVRPVDIRDARKVIAFPSPNTIMGILAKPGVEHWSEDLLIDATLQAIRDAEVMLAPEVDRAHIRELHRQAREKAADAGSAIHAEIESAILKQFGKVDAYGHDPNVDPRIVEAALDWLDASDVTVDDVEVVFTNKRWGIGGKIDVVGTWKNPFRDRAVIVDWKSQDTRGKGFRIYPEDKTPLLAAYAMGYYDDLDVDCWNVFLSRDEPGQIQGVKYSKEDIEDGWDTFVKTYEVWVKKAKYDPREGR
jgi:hypothetical protein